MGQVTTAAIAAWQKRAGIEPATGEQLRVLNELQQQAFDLIRVIELEKSGIRDGDGAWHGSDALVGVIADIGKAGQFFRYSNAHDDELPDIPF